MVMDKNTNVTTNTNAVRNILTTITAAPTKWQRRSHSHLSTAPVSALVANAVYLPRQPVV